MTQVEKYLLDLICQPGIKTIIFKKEMWTKMMISFRGETQELQNEFRNNELKSGLKNGFLTSLGPYRYVIMKREN